ncbi:hypothetical protein ACFFRR_010287 [Megaselia abdita]
MLTFHSFGMSIFIQIFSSRWKALLKSEPATLNSSADAASVLVGGGTSSVLWKCSESSFQGVILLLLAFSSSLKNSSHRKKICCLLVMWLPLIEVRNPGPVCLHFDKIFALHFCPSRSQSYIIFALLVVICRPNRRDSAAQSCSY